jgi:hypothetical protein
MSTNTEQEQPTVESTSTVSNETENLPASSADDAATAGNPTPVVEEQKPSFSPSSWFNNISMPPNLTNQLTNLSSSFLQVTSKVTAAANTLVQKTLPQRPSSPTEGEQTEGATKNEEGQENIPTSEENPEAAAGTNKDLTRKCCDNSLDLCRFFNLFRNVQ